MLDSLLKLNVYILYEPVISLLGIHSIEIQTQGIPKLTRKFIALFEIALN